MSAIEVMQKIGAMSVIIGAKTVALYNNLTATEITSRANKPKHSMTRAALGARQVTLRQRQVVETALS